MCAGMCAALTVTPHDVLTTLMSVVSGQPSSADVWSGLLPSCQIGDQFFKEYGDLFYSGYDGETESMKIGVTH